jgi:hypothetical protein
MTGEAETRRILSAARVAFRPFAQNPKLGAGISFLEDSEKWLGRKQKIELEQILFHRANLIRDVVN